MCHNQMLALLSNLRDIQDINLLLRLVVSLEKKMERKFQLFIIDLWKKLSCEIFAPLSNLPLVKILFLIFGKLR